MLYKIRIPLHLNAHALSPEGWITQSFVGSMRGRSRAARADGTTFVFLSTAGTGTGELLRERRERELGVVGVAVQAGLAVAPASREDALQDYSITVWKHHRQHAAVGAMRPSHR